MAFGAYAIWYVLHLVIGNTISTVVAIFGGALIYAVALVTLRGITKYEMLKLPKGELLVRFFTRLGLLH
jgi:stage V sporulation protein B